MSAVLMLRGNPNDRASTPSVQPIEARPTAGIRPAVVIFVEASDQVGGPAIRTVELSDVQVMHALLVLLGHGVGFIEGGVAVVEKTVWEKRAQLIRDGIEALGGLGPGEVDALLEAALARVTLEIIRVWIVVAQSKPVPDLATTHDTTSSLS